MKIETFRGFVAVVAVIVVVDEFIVAGIFVGVTGGTVVGVVVVVSIIFRLVV